ncbi:MAG: MarR family transcriptional regulator [Treponema sp.]|nr:MarR family transcriptional regulator [Candidatus Treponema equifaecale]
MDYSVSSILSLVSRVHSLAADFLQKKLSDKGLPELTSSHGFILFCLAKNQMTMGELSSKINRDKSTTTFLVRKLESLGFVQIRKSDEDSRKKILSLTEKGSEYNAITEEISTQLLEGAYKNFEEAEKQKLLELLVKMSENLE